MQKRRFIAGLGATLVTAALPWRAAFAQRQRDTGEYQILEARYGTPDRNIDVTRRLRQIARSEGQVRVTNELFGDDPAFGEVKALRIYARGRDGGTRIFEYRENDFIDTSLFIGWRGGRWGQEGGWRGGWGGDAGGPRGGPRGGLAILSARYGDGRRSRDVTDRVRALARGGRLDLQVENDLFGMDPAPGRTKELVLVYAIDGVQQELRVPEHMGVSLP